MSRYIADDLLAVAPHNYQHIVKIQNIKQAFDLIRHGVCSSRSDLAARMHISATAASSIAAELVKAGVVLEAGHTLSAQPGRRPVKFILNNNSAQLAVFSLTRRGILFTLYSLSCNVIEEFFLAHPSDIGVDSDRSEEYTALFRDVLLRRSRAFDREKAIVIGINFPGIHLKNEHAFFICTAMDMSISEDAILRLEQEMGIPVLMANVTNCLAYAEKSSVALSEDGHGEDMLFVNVCDGVGAGIIINGNIHTGTYDTAGEMGHISIDFDGPLCHCGNRGCLEQYVNLNAILNRTAQACRENGIVPPAQFEDIAALMHHACVQDVLDDIARKLVFGISSMICATGIQTVVLGGGIEILGEGFLVRLQGLLNQRSILAKRAKLVYARTGPKGAGLGLAQYFLDKLYYVTQ